MKQTVIALAIAGGATIALSLCPLCESTSSHKSVARPGASTAFAATDPALPVGHDDTSSTAVVRLRVVGMTCGGCVLGVRKVLTQVDGVNNADVSYETGLAIVTFDPRKASVAQMVTAIKTLGYTATVVRA